MASTFIHDSVPPRVKGLMATITHTTAARLTAASCFHMHPEWQKAYKNFAVLGYVLIFSDHSVWL